MVEWWETKAKVACPNPLPRKDAFQPDPQLLVETSIKEDYVGSGYDRGHMSPAASNVMSAALSISAITGVVNVLLDNVCESDNVATVESMAKAPDEYVNPVPADR